MKSWSIINSMPGKSTVRCVHGVVGDGYREKASPPLIRFKKKHTWHGMIGGGENGAGTCRRSVYKFGHC